MHYPVVCNVGTDLKPYPFSHTCIMPHASGSGVGGKVDIIESPHPPTQRSISDTNLTPLKCSSFAAGRPLQSEMNYNLVI
jgi:hypothetical protein